MFINKVYEYTISDKEKNKNKDRCPRCGELTKECDCHESDFYSTINIYRIPKGKEFKKA